jgi:hypothetical protein
MGIYLKTAIEPPQSLLSAEVVAVTNPQILDLRWFSYPAGLLRRDGGVCIYFAETGTAR